MSFTGVRLFALLMMSLMLGIGSSLAWSGECRSNNLMSIELRKVDYQWEVDNAASNNVPENCALKFREHDRSTKEDNHIWLRGAGGISLMGTETNNMF